MSKESEYPEPFQSELISTGSRTIDNGASFHIAVDSLGFCVTRELGPWSVQDLFGDMSYWPENEVWTDSNISLDDLLTGLAKANRLRFKDVLDPVIQELDIASYLSAEKKTIKVQGDFGKLWEQWPNLQGSHLIPGLPSPEMGSDCFYNGIELDFDEDGWTAKLCCVDTEDLAEFFIPETCNAPTFDELFGLDLGSFPLEDVLPWTRDELISLLIEDDPRWQKYIESE